MTFSIPDLDPEFETQLREIVEQKQYIIDTSEAENRWTAIILPKLIDRLDDIVKVSSNEGEQFSRRPEGVDLIQAIRSIQIRVVEHLHENFPKHPPFTIHRLSEILIDGKKEGYELNNNVQILKYFNSLSTLVLVSTNVSDFPPTTFSAKPIQPSVEVVEPIITSQSSSINIPLVEIPWLKENNATLKADTSLDEGDSTHNMSNESPVNDDMIISPPPSEEKPSSSMSSLTDMINPSPIRRRRENDQELLSSLVIDSTNNLIKRPKTDISKDSSSSIEEMDITSVVKENVDDASDDEQISTTEDI